ncbi:polynucleotide adenylyltransferase [Diplodia seriata]
MAGQSARRWGVTDPISRAPPTDAELALDAALLDELRGQNTFEAPEETEKRGAALQTLQKAVEEFVRHVGHVKGLAPSVIENAGGKICTFGSYRLGVYGPGSDIDTLVLSPKHVTRDDFFAHFINVLERVAPPGAIEKFSPVPDAFTPIIKMDFLGIDIDLIFARLAIASVPLDLDLKDNSLLRGLDETDLRSVNGTRVTDEVLSLVPQPKIFRQVTRAVKLWAQRHAIYANIVGFPGGIAWAMMVARICQLYPMACAAVVLGRFFYLMSTWPWPRPIMLKEIEDGPLQVRVWNPQIYPGDKRHLMPIITPAYPSMCATHNITHSTQKVIKRELLRASQITSDILAEKRRWRELFDKHTFFTQDFKYYLSIVAASHDKEAQDNWSSSVESKVRKLVGLIEQSPAEDVELAQPFNKGFKRVHHCKTEEDKEEVLQGSVKYSVKTDTTNESNGMLQDIGAGGAADKLDLSNGDANGKEANGDTPITVYTTTFYIGIELKPGAKSLDISYAVSEFKRLCQEWANYDQNLHSIRIVHTRSYDLPDDCFDAGETKPVKAKKAKATKKRSHREAGMEYRKLRGIDKMSATNSDAAHPAAHPPPSEPKSKGDDYPTHSNLLMSGAKKIFNKASILHPQQVYTARLKAAEQRANPPLRRLSADRPQQPEGVRKNSLTHQQKAAMSTSAATTTTGSSKPGEHFEPRQTATDEDYTPDPSRSLPLDGPRQALVDDIIALYSCAPTVERVRRYTADCVYDDQFVYANDRFKMAGQWFALPKLFNASVNNGYQVIKNERDFIQFKNDQSWTFRVIPKTARVTGLVSLSLDPDTVDSDFIQVKYHKDQANDKDYSHEGLGFTFKKWQADQVAKHMDSEEVKAFEADKTAAKEHVRKYGTGKEEGNAPKEDFTKY